MNHLVREFIETHTQYNATLKHMPDFEGDIRRLNRFRKFKKSQKSKWGRSKIKSKLSFEVNIDADDDALSRSVTKVQAKAVKKNITKLKKQTRKKVPRQFIKHIVKLGFDAKDAARLYADKDDWLGMSSGGLILCTERGCKFSTPLSNDCLFEHCRTVHGWRDYPCERDNCDFVAYSKTSAKDQQSKFHSPYQTHNGNYYSCQRPNCKAAFSSNADLSRHERIHSNKVLHCVFCPYVSARHQALSAHQRVHFNTREFVCGVCQKAFTTVSMLNVHVGLKHDTEEEKTKCPLCERVDLRHRIQVHLRHQHVVTGLKWDHEVKQYIVPEQIK